VNYLNENGVKPDSLPELHDRGFNEKWMKEKFIPEEDKNKLSDDNRFEI